MKVLITGLTGFVGQALSYFLLSRNHSIIGYGSGFSQPPLDLLNKIQWINAQSINAREILDNQLHECDAVIHLAAKVHQLNAIPHDFELFNAEYFKVNTRASLELANQAAKARVKRFIFLSTIKVNGESTEIGTPFHSDDVPRPQGPYALSKWEAEKGLSEIAKNSEMEVVIIRPPLVYGKNAKANLASLLKLVRTAIPLPFGSLDHNLRSFISIDNLISFIELCLHSDAAKNKTLLISDNHDLSTKELITLLAQASNLKPKLFSCPSVVLKNMFSLLGRSDAFNRLTDSLQLDVSKTLSELSWSPPYTVHEEIQKMCVR